MHRCRGIFDYFWLKLWLEIFRYWLSPRHKYPHTHTRARWHKSSLAYKDTHYIILMYNFIRYIKIENARCDVSYSTEWPQKAPPPQQHRNHFCMAWLRIDSAHFELWIQFSQYDACLCDACVYISPPKNAIFLTSTSFPFHLITSHLLNKRKSFTVWLNAWEIKYTS